MNIRKKITYFVLLMKSHLQSYPCPLQINSFWNWGFLLGIVTFDLTARLFGIMYLAVRFMNVPEFIVFGLGSQNFIYSEAQRHELSFPWNLLQHQPTIKNKDS